MPRWNTIDDATLDERTLYTVTYGFRDNEALGGVWSRTLNGLTRATVAAMNASARLHANEYETVRSLVESMWVVGPFITTVSEIIDDMDEPARADEFRDDVRTSATGYCY